MISKLMGRILAVIPVVLFQLWWWLFLLQWIAPYASIINALLSAASFFFVLYIITKQDEGTYKILWLLVLLIAPIPGALLYLLFGNKRTTMPLKKRLRKAEKGLPEAGWGDLVLALGREVAAPAGPAGAPAEPDPPLDLPDHRLPLAGGRGGGILPCGGKALRSHDGGAGKG